MHILIIKIILSILALGIAYIIKEELKNNVNLIWIVSLFGFIMLLIGAI